MGRTRILDAIPVLKAIPQIPTMTCPLTIITFLDGLSPHYLAPYGCTWVEQPALNRLAAGSLVFENATIETTRGEDNFRAFLRAWSDVNSNIDGKSDTWLVATDQPVQSETNDVLASFAWMELSPATPPSEADGLAPDVVATHLGQCFSQLTSIIDHAELPLTLFVHLTSLARVWDAPREWRERYPSEDDPPAGDWTTPPIGTRPESDEGDDLMMGLAWAHAAQLDCLDACLGSLLDYLDISGLLDPSLIALVGNGGLPLGRHDRIGMDPDYLYSDATECPVFLKLPGQLPGQGFRDYELIQPSQLVPLIDALAKENFVPDKVIPARPRSTAAVTKGRCSTAIRVPDWYMIDHSNRISLFSKPDDRWDINEISSLRNDVVQEMEATLQQRLSEPQVPNVQANSKGNENG